MKNKYEFKIEDINVVQNTSHSSDKYTETYTRKLNDDGSPTRSFIVTYSALPEDCKTDDNKVITICKKCGAWNTFDKVQYNSEDFQYNCHKCHNNHEDIISEEDLIKIILSLTDDEETFFESDLYINDVHIQ